jgi:glycosyltransferase involved in cell wall biosynthesis
MIMEGPDSKSKIVWLPASPLEGWASMDRYWRELDRIVGTQPLKGLDFSCILHQPPPRRSDCGPQWKRAVEKYITYPKRVRKVQADLCHLLDHSYAHLLPFLPKTTKKLVTVFDLVPLETDGELSQKQIERFRRSVENLHLADHLVSISAETKKKLNSILGIPLEKITVAVPGMDFALFQTPVPPHNKILQRLSFVPPVIVSVGSTAGRKNLGSLPGIFREMRHLFEQKQCCFVRAGAFLPEALRKELTEIIGEDSLIELGPLFGDDLIALYQVARVLIFPSVLEGLTFIIPEAMAAGCPVVTNTLTANPEAAGDAGLYYEEGDAAMAAAQLKAVLLNGEVHSSLQKAGLARASQMTWEHHFETVLKVYRHLLE